jgi:hypothetical protein
MGSSNFPDRPFRLRDVTTVARQEQANNRSLVNFQVWVDKLSYSPTWSGGGPSITRWGYDGTVRSSGDGGGFDFQGTGPWLMRSGQVWVTHNSNGTKSITVQVSADFALLGATSFSYGMTLPTISSWVPPAPVQGRLDQITGTSMRYQFTANGNGGSPITTWEIQYTGNPGNWSGAPILQTPNTMAAFSGLTNSRTYEFRARGVNANGPGDWGAGATATTLGVPPAPINGVLDQITGTSMRYTVSNNGNGGSQITGWEFQYTGNPGNWSGAPIVASGTNMRAFTGLRPYTLYEFRARAINAVGTGDWGAGAQARTLSTVWISTGTEWVPAEVLISNGTAWLPASTVISDGTAWRATG